MDTTKRDISNAKRSKVTRHFFVHALHAFHRLNRRYYVNKNLKNHNKSPSLPSVQSGNPAGFTITFEPTEDGEMVQACSKLIYNDTVYTL